MGRRRKEAGNKSRLYVRIQFDGVLHYAHRLAFLYMTGQIPDQVDHKDGNPANNSWANLRETTSADNGKNTKHRGYHQARSGRFCAQLTTEYKTKHLGTFDSSADAREAYEAAKKASHAAWATGQHMSQGA
jgi:hypothetical protein